MTHSAASQPASRIAALKMAGCGFRKPISSEVMMLLSTRCATPRSAKSHWYSRAPRTCRGRIAAEAANRGVHQAVRVLARPWAGLVQPGGSTMLHRVRLTVRPFQNTDAPQLADWLH